MKPRTLCIIEPPPGPSNPACQEIRDQLAGLVVTTVSREQGDSWSVAPSPMLVTSFNACDRSGRPIKRGKPFEVYVLESWLRPIRGIAEPSSATHDTTTPTDALA